MAHAVMMKGAALAQRHADHRLLGSGSRLRNGLRHFARLAMTEAGAALAIADDDERGETEALAALHGLGDAVDMDELLDELLALVRAPPTPTTTLAAATAPPATVPHPRTAERR